MISPLTGFICAVLGELEIKTMSRRLARISLALVILLSSEVWALGLGDIRMNSALNEPLSARIELLSASPEELDNLKLGIGGQYFEGPPNTRYDLIAPVFNGGFMELRYTF